MIQKPFEAITNFDIDLLLTNAVIESTTLEYKQDLPGNGDNDKKEFLADVSSFANARGGDMIYGISPKVDRAGKKTGEPLSVAAITGTTADEAKLRLESMIREGIAPRLPVQIKDVTGWGSDGNGFIILIRIPKSFASPHMVTYKGTSRFYSRHSAGKFQLDVTEIRSAVLATESQADRIKHFREERLARIVADDLPIALSSRHRLVMHVIPLTNYLNRERLDLTSPQIRPQLKFRPFGSRGGDERFNLDGFLTWSGRPGEPSRSYTQLFFDGAIEAVCADLLRGPLGEKVQDGVGEIASIGYEQFTIEALREYLLSYKSLGVTGPIAVSLSILNCRGSYLAVNYWSGNSHPIDRDAVILQEVLFDDVDVDVPRILKPLFDQVWNACGFPKSFNYTETGDWKPR
jgi:hypothetical protein